MDRDPCLDVDGREDGAARAWPHREPGTPLLEQVPIGLEQRLHLAAVVAAANRGSDAAPAPIHYVLERVGKVVLTAPPRRRPQHVSDPVEQRLPILDVIQTD